MISYCLEFAAVSLVIVQWASNTNKDGQFVRAAMFVLVSRLDASIALSLQNKSTCAISHHPATQLNIRSEHFFRVDSRGVCGEHRLHFRHCVLPWPHVRSQTRSLCRVSCGLESTSPLPHAYYFSLFSAVVHFLTAYCFVDISQASSFLCASGCRNCQADTLYVIWIIMSTRYYWCGCY